jgi:4-diphosphocytidyl-2-C-methyl-D-erythritol kinase
MLVTEQAFAKINLALHVIGRKADGYHELDSIVAFAGICDVLTLEPAASTSLVLSGPFAGDLSAGSDNTVLAAWRLLAGAAEIAPVKFHLEKNLPVASGIGGGSADAAACIRGLIRLFNLRIPSEELNAMALTLGADVPVCLASQSCRMQGIGEILLPFEHELPEAILLVNPGVPSVTARVFEVLGLERGQQFGLPITNFDVWRNDLTFPAIKCVPEIATVIEVIKSQAHIRGCSMSGSGATCFGLCETLDAAEDAALAIKSSHPHWWVSASTLGD